MKRLRIAAKRMAAERAQDARSAATSRSPLASALSNFDACLISVEKALGFGVPEKSEAPLTLESAKALVGTKKLIWVYYKRREYDCPFLFDVGDVKFRCFC